MTILEGRWDCSQCNTTNIPGGKLNCPHCGDSRNQLLDPTEAPYLPTDARVVTDVEDLQMAASGPTWNCGKCGQLNRGIDKTCCVCEEPKRANDDQAAIHTHVTGVDAEGAVLSDPDQVDVDRINAVLQAADPLQALEDGPVTPPNRTFLGNGVRDSADRPQDTKPGGESYASSKPRPSFGDVRNRLTKLPIWALVAVLGIIALVAGGQTVYTNFIKTETVDLTVQSLSWERQLEVESYVTQTHEDWSVPTDGRVISSRREVRLYNRMIDHYETRTRQVPERRNTGSHQEQYVCGTRTVNKGNGYYSSESTYCPRTVQDYTTVYRPESYQEAVWRDDPVYDIKYTYQVDRWVTDHFERASGRTNPQWPKPRITSTRQREGNERRQTYEVVLVDPKGRTSEHRTDESKWSRVQEGTVIHAKQTRKGAVRDVQWP